MLHTPSHVIVYSVYEYDLFSKISGNRKINKDKIKRIIKEIRSGNDMLKYYPIQVIERNDKLEVVDGQHRLEISKQLKQPVYYILVKEEKTISDIAKVNTNVEKWKGEDFIECYVSKGNEHYIKLREFLKQHPFAIGFAVKLLSGDTLGDLNHSEVIMNQFTAGEFEIKNLAAAESLVEAIKLFPFKGIYQRAFAIAVKMIIDAGMVPIADIAAAVQKRPELLMDQHNYKNYILKLQDIYNVGKRNYVIIYQRPEKAKPVKPVKEKPVKKPEPVKPVMPVRDLEKGKKAFEAKNNAINKSPAYQKKVRKEEPRFKTKTASTDKVPLKIDSKTTIYIDKNANPEHEKRRYLKTHTSITSQYKK